MKIATRMLGVVAAIALGLPTSAVYAHGGNASLIHACDKSNSYAYIVGPNQTCNLGGSPVHWNITGVAGPTGLTGAPGPAGTNGVDGTNGAPGPQGLAGANGTNGTDGVDGADGAPGLKGDKGDKGDTGDVGPQGVPGVDGVGEKGETGPAGADSTVAGPKGDKGDTGESIVGPMGPEGLPAIATTPIIWSGGCSEVGLSQVWNLYCANAVEFNTADQYLTADLNGTITFDVGGFYRVNVHMIGTNNGAESHVGHIQSVLNGEGSHLVSQTFELGQYNTFDADTIYRVAAGDTLALFHNFVLHSYPNNRLQIEYLGPLPVVE